MYQHVMGKRATKTNKSVKTLVGRQQVIQQTMRTCDTAAAGDLLTDGNGRGQLRSLSNEHG